MTNEETLSFKESTQDTIQEFESLLCKQAKISDFNDLVKKSKRFTPTYKCQTTWQKDQISIRCVDCGLESNSCICLQCYLNGNHEGHTIEVHTRFVGNCDCGDSDLWKPSGTCNIHRHNETSSPLSELEVSISPLLQRIFDLSATQLPNLLQTNPSGSVLLIKWFLQFCSIGDNFRRMIVTSLSRYNIFSDLINSCITSEYAAVEALSELLGRCTNDSMFKVTYGHAYLQNYLKLIKINHEMVVNGGPHEKMELLLWSAFHYLSKKVILECIQRYNFDWCQFYIDLYSTYQELQLEYVLQPEICKRIVSNNSDTIFNFFRILIEAKELNDKQRFVDNLIDVFLKENVIFYTNINEDSQENDFLTYSFYSLGIAVTCDGFKKCENLNIGNVLKKMEKYLNKIYVEQEFDKMLQKPIFKHSLFDGCSISLYLAPYYFITSLLLTQNENMKTVLNNSVEDVDNFLLLTSLNTQRILISTYFLFNQYLSSCFGYKIFIFYQRVDKSYSDLFSLMQICSGFIHDKEKLINLIAHNFGIFDEKVNETNNLIYFDFIHFISTLIFDRIYITRNIDEEINQRLIGKLLLKPKLFKPLNKVFQSQKVKDTTKIKSHLNEISNPTNSLNGVLFELKSKSLWDPLTPFYQVNKTLSKYSKYIKKYPNELMPFKEFIKEPFGMDLISLLTTPTLLAIEYYILLCKNSQETNQLILNLLINASQITQKNNLTLNNEIIKIDSIEELINYIKNNNNFENILYQKFEFKSYQPKSFIDLINDLGTIGQIALSKMNITNSQSKTNNNANKTENNNKMLNLKAKIMQNFNSKLQTFEKDNENEFDETNDLTTKETCCICRSTNQEDEILCYPIYVYNSRVPFDNDIYLNNTIKCSPCFTICTHLAHKECLCENNQCPIDRYIRNMFLPKLDDRNDLSNPLITEITNSFKEIISQFIKCEYIIASLSSLIIIYELRLRANPLVLNNRKYYLLARNLYLNLKTIYLNNQNEFVDNEKSNIYHFVFNVIKDENKFNEIVNEIATKLKGKELNLFLRQVKIFEYFVLGKNYNNETFNDWKLILTNENLCNYYKFDFDGNEYEFEPFKLMKLPKNYLHFAKEPYNLSREIMSSSEFYFVNLQNGVVSNKKQLLFAISLSQEQLYLFMNLNVQHSKIQLIIKMNNGKLYGCNLHSVYVDFLGNEGVGFENEFELFLSDERLEKLTDEYLSGEVLQQMIA